MYAFDLKPCPFCGGKAVLHVSKGDGVFAVCTKCQSRTVGACDTIVDGEYAEGAAALVVKFWNKRV